MSGQDDEFKHVSQNQACISVRVIYRPLFNLDFQQHLPYVIVRQSFPEMFTKNSQSFLRNPLDFGMRDTERSLLNNNCYVFMTHLHFISHTTCAVLLYITLAKESVFNYLYLVFYYQLNCLVRLPCMERACCRPRPACCLPPGTCPLQPQTHMLFTTWNMPSSSSQTTSTWACHWLMTICLRKRER